MSCNKAPHYPMQIERQLITVLVYGKKHTSICILPQQKKKTLMNAVHNDFFRIGRAVFLRGNDTTFYSNRYEKYRTWLFAINNIDESSFSPTSGNAAPTLDGWWHNPDCSLSLTHSFARDQMPIAQSQLSERELQSDSNSTLAMPSLLSHGITRTPAVIVRKSSTRSRAVRRRQGWPISVLPGTQQRGATETRLPWAPPWLPPVS